MCSSNLWSLGLGMGQDSRGAGCVCDVSYSGKLPAVLFKTGEDGTIVLRNAVYSCAFAWRAYNEYGLPFYLQSSAFLSFLKFKPPCECGILMT